MAKITGKGSTREVMIDGEILDPKRSQKAYNHSPDGFNWGYGGSGPAQLALAIMLEYLDKDSAMMMYQSFKWDMIANLKQGEDFEMDEVDVLEWIAKKEKSNETRENQVAHMEQ